MIGILFVAIAEIALQWSASIGKYEAAKRRESVYALGFLTWFWTTVFLLIWGTVGPGSFVFSLESLPTFGARVVLEILMMYVTIRALVEADRSTFSFLRSLSIPLLLTVDIFLGYTFTTAQIAGVLIIIAGSGLLFSRKSLGRRGRLMSVLSALIAVATISLYKYNITHYNSIEAEQFLVHLIMLIVLVIGAYVRRGENLFKYLFKPVFLGQSLLSGVGGVLMSFAYLYAPASVITAAKRSFEIIYSIVVGHAYFHERHFVVKLLAACLVISGIGLATIT